MRRLVFVFGLTLALTGCSGTWMFINGYFAQPIVWGGQASIDAGNVTDVSSWCPADSRHLAGHRSSHGSVFNALPSNLEVGDTVIIRQNGHNHDYRVVARTRGYDCDDIWGELVIQTSHPDGGAYLWHLEQI